MAEENKSQLISEAELIEAINADTLVSISLGAGQPQKNVKLSTLASVVAGLLPTATQSEQGAMSPNDKRFTEGVTIYNTTIQSEETWVVPQLDQRAIYLITLSFRGTDAEHMSTYILHQNSEYAKSVQQISLFNYKSNTSVSVVKNDNGTYGIKITPTFPNLGGGGVKLTYRILSTRT